jgi:hypothetical protein
LVPAVELPRQIGDVMVEPWVRETLNRLNPEIAAQPDRADEVIYNLRACILSVQQTDWCGPMKTSWPGYEAKKVCHSALAASTCLCGWWILPSPPTTV